ncbi:Exodeoxyribonuclease VII large subunit [Sulfuricurvum kujiense DSM 16994]|uniref:Exodeoxyribonuclease 7 large subunit n=1 Tax=Sulfuricurvum kujiense (strain ATCC BAA-921 / DSM 16994 / JCM 11577 / YK-1) TaxID=709032 RepID=E4TZW7_SULKY|nr:exodeoxyribonuclease VII large subunit [Sulfuricurvum kujiense]ADR33132.1 Exodeoxyribonuclease VII large subunit [Sulfuricurvum kujiense DSM 16994]
MASTLSVSSLNEQIKTLLETSFEFVSVEGELSRVTKHGSGHIYFTLKDNESAIKCVMFKGNASRLKFSLEEGAHVILHGALSLYKPRGEYQINAFSAEPYGAGALAVAFEQLKQKLEAKGYFDPTRKKPFPKFPQTVVLVTSATGAALQDMQRVATQRWPLVKLIVLDVLVQGPSASGQIADALRTADTLHADAVVVGRGGGSIEDLWAFNEEIVADALYAMKTPTISAVGHEIDWVISDYVADMRAPTPSAAMQMLLPDQNELSQSIDEIRYGAYGMITQRLERKREQLLSMQEAFKRHGVEHRLEVQQELIKELRERLNRQMTQRLEQSRREIIPLMERLSQNIESILRQKQFMITQLSEGFNANHPKNKNKSGFAQIAREGKVIDLDALSVGDRFEAMNDKRVVRAEVVEIVSINVD